ncbi:reelin domain-containing protein 1 isoform X3 [Podarcis raffonei]|uniref:reelin domain-containing protein 1 isoform X3 n=1 Tax=Podarcis raffonei TaxID=65483 RepID=UPI0023298BC3|nr:reelin domain-containing protein 1 isoform X3 [Podarcis raffonei]
MCPKVEEEMKVQALFVVWSLTILCLVSYTAAFSHGASLSACTDMRPKHIRAHLQNPQNNYITIHTNISFFPGDKVPVTVRSTRDFMGFMLQARRVSNDQIAGTFVYIPPGSKLLTCFEDGDTVTHSDKSLKRNLSFVWKAPDQPIGDIRFFLSVVQSYFVYWARIESSTVSQQTQNRTTAGSHVAPSVIKPTPLQKSTDLKGAFAAEKESSTPDTILTQFAKFTHTSLTRLAATLILDPSYSGRQVSEPPDNGNALSESLADLVTSHAISRSRERQANGSGTVGDLTLEPSLQFQDLGLIAQHHSSSHSMYNRRENTSSFPISQLCSTCIKGMEGVSATPNPGLSKSVLPITASPLAHFQDPLRLPGIETISEHLGGEEDMSVYQSLSGASRKMAEKQAATWAVPANFLPQAELTSHEQEEKGRKDIPENTLLKVTRATPKATVSGGKPRKESQLVVAQLGVLLGCSAVLSMVLAVGLRCIHSQYCHKRTEVSFSEPENNAMALQENGEMMHFRKIRENSFVLVQAEYNWISPSGSGKKAVL